MDLPKSFITVAKNKDTSWIGRKHDYSAKETVCLDFEDVSNKEQ